MITFFIRTNFLIQVQSDKNENEREKKNCRARSIESVRAFILTLEFCFIITNQSINQSIEFTITESEKEINRVILRLYVNYYFLFSNWIGMMLGRNKNTFDIKLEKVIWISEKKLFEIIFHSMCKNPQGKIVYVKLNIDSHR